MVSCARMPLTSRLSDRRWQRASTEADDVVKPVTHKLKRTAAVRCSISLGRVVVIHKKPLSKSRLHESACFDCCAPPALLHRFAESLLLRLKLGGNRDVNPGLRFYQPVAECFWHYYDVRSGLTLSAATPGPWRPIATETISRRWLPRFVRRSHTTGFDRSGSGTAL